MSDEARARPCPMCEVLTAGADVVTSVYQAKAFREHVLSAHPGWDPASAWDMPLPRAKPALHAVRSDR